MHPQHIGLELLPVDWHGSLYRLCNAHTEVLVTHGVGCADAPCCCWQQTVACTVAAFMVYIHGVHAGASCHGVHQALWLHSGCAFRVCILSILGAFMAFMQVPVVTASEAAKLLQEQPEQYVLVDVRNREEQQVGSEGVCRGAPGGASHALDPAEGSGVAEAVDFAKIIA